MAKASEREKQLELALEQERGKTELTQAIIRVGLEALAPRILTTLGLILDGVLFVWVMVAPGWERLTAAVLFAIAAWCIVNLKPTTKETQHEHEQQTEA